MSAQKSNHKDLLTSTELIWKKLGSLLASQEETKMEITSALQQDYQQYAASDTSYVLRSAARRIDACE
jgi:hypothetical protein